MLIAIVKNVKPITTKTGKRMGVVTVEDYNGSIELTFFSEAWAKYETALSIGRILGFQGYFKENKEALSFVVNSVYGDVSQMKATNPINMYIEVIHRDVSSGFVRQLRRHIVSHHGKVAVRFAVYENREQIEGEEENLHNPRIIATSERFCVDPSEELVENLKNLEGVFDVYLE